MTLIDYAGKIGREIQVMREDLGWTQAELAEQIGVSQSAVSTWESGNGNIATTTQRRIEALYRTCKAGAAKMAVLAVLVVMLAGHVLAQSVTQPASLPDAPRRVITVNRALYSADLTLRLMDTVTTHSFLNDSCACFHEANPISPSSQGWSHIAAFQSAAFGVVAGGSSRLGRRHPRLARTALILDIASEIYAVQNNLRRSNAVAGQPVSTLARPR